MKCIRFEVTSMFGYTLRQGCIIVGFMTVAISLLKLFYALGCILQDPPENGYNSDPSVAVQLIYGLYSASASIYQIIISLLLAWQAKLAEFLPRVRALENELIPSKIRRIFRVIAQKQESIFFCTIWHISQLSILTFYFILYSAMVAICFEKHDFLVGSLIAVFAIIYICIFVYFAIVVNSFSNSLDQDIYY